jgi:hypothetical protein
MSGTDSSGGKKKFRIPKRPRAEVSLDEHQKLDPPGKKAAAGASDPNTAAACDASSGVVAGSASASSSATTADGAACPPHQLPSHMLHPSIRNRLMDPVPRPMPMQRSRAPNAIPAGWLECSKGGDSVCGMCAIKTPLSPHYTADLSPETRWTPMDAVMACGGRRVKLVIDLTSTSRYYKAEELPTGVTHVKLAVQGHSVPTDAAVKSALDRLRDLSGHADAVGDFTAIVHCTHGLNRTGYDDGAPPPPAPSPAPPATPPRRAHPRPARPQQRTAAEPLSRPLQSLASRAHPSAPHHRHLRAPPARCRPQVLCGTRAGHLARDVLAGRPRRIQPDAPAGHMARGVRAGAAHQVWWPAAPSREAPILGATQGEAA